MKLRNQLLALFCLLVFVAFGVVIFKTWVVEKPFGIILFLSDGLDTGTLTAARLYEGGVDGRLAIERFQRLALVSSEGNDYAVPDAAAAATAIATGEKVDHRSIAIDPKGRSLPSLLALARKAGRATGLVTTGNLTDPAMAAFYAHTKDARDTATIAEQFVNEANVDLALGGGLADFTPESKGGKRSDGRDLWLELRSKGYQLIRNKAELENTPVFLTGPLVGIFSDAHMAFSHQKESGSQQPTLADMVQRAIEFLQTNRNGYLLVVDCALISEAARQNRGEQTLIETLAFDEALRTARRFAGEKTLIVAVGKQNIGGLQLNGYPLRSERGVSLLGTNTQGYPSLTWSSGPNGPDLKAEAPATPKAASEPAAFYAPAALPTAGDMIMVGSGPGAEVIGGFMKSTRVFTILQNAL